MKNKTNIILVSLILSVMILSPMINARSSPSSELVKGWNIVEFSEDVAWIDLRLSDGTIELSIHDAIREPYGWLQGGLMYWGEDKWFSGFYYYHYIDESGSSGKTSVSANEQVLAYAYQDGISIVVDKPNMVKLKPYNPEKKNKKFFKED